MPARQRSVPGWTFADGMVAAEVQGDWGVTQTNGVPLTEMPPADSPDTSHQDDLPEADAGIGSERTPADPAPDTQPAADVAADVAADAAAGDDAAAADDAAAGDAADLTVGAVLRRARTRAGLSLADIAERTKVRPGILSDVEADAHDRLPALTYALGFVKAYARTVGLDPVAIGERYRRESQKMDPMPTIVDLQPLEAKRLPSAGLVALTAAVVVLILGGLWLWGTGVLTRSGGTAPDAAPVTTAAPATPAPGAAAGATSGAAVAADHSADQVTLIANDEVWLRIADGNEIFHTGTLKAGDRLELPRARAWKLRTGRAGALEVKVGDRTLPPLGGPVQQLHNLSLAPADLLARAQASAG